MNEVLCLSDVASRTNFSEPHYAPPASKLGGPTRHFIKEFVRVEKVYVDSFVWIHGQFK